MSDFRDVGLCAEIDPELFYPERGCSVREPISVCLACPVRAECLAWALETDERWGVWGGTSEQQRAKMRRERRRAAA